MRAPAARGLQGGTHGLHQPYPRAAGRVWPGVRAGAQGAARGAGRGAGGRIQRDARRCPALDRAFLQWRELDEHIGWCDAQITRHVKTDDAAAQAMRIVGVGPTSASAFVAGVGDFRQFKNAGQFAAWLGLVPKQNSSGGKTVLGRITKRGDEYLRLLLVQGARSVVASAAKRSDPVSKWIVQLQARIGWQKTLVAVANKNARILWAVLARGKVFDAHHVSTAPHAAVH